MAALLRPLAELRELGRRIRARSLPALEQGLLVTARAGGALPVLANFAFERSAGETASP